MKYLFLLLILCTGCAEVGLYNSKEDCRGSVQRNTPSGYPCNCCPMGE